MAPAERLNQLLTAANSAPLSDFQAAQCTTYLTLLQKWNARTNLTAIRDEEGILSRHFLESILAARLIDVNLSNLLDFGSGAGFPGLPIAILRPEIQVTLAESQNKKAAFLREVLRTLNLTHVQVHAARAETLAQRFDCITLRAVDNMPQAVSAAIPLLAPGGCLALLTTAGNSQALKIHAEQSSVFTWLPGFPLPAGTDRILLLGRQQGS